MSGYSTSSAVQDLAPRLDQLTQEVAFIGQQLERIANVLESRYDR